MISEAPVIMTQAAEALNQHRERLAQAVSDRCFAELESYKSGDMPREESVNTVRRLLSFLITALQSQSAADASSQGSSVHDELVKFEEGIAARRVRLAIEFSDLIRGLQIMRSEVWTCLEHECKGADTAGVFLLQRRINEIFDAFFIGLSSSYIKSQNELIAGHEKALKKWEEVVKSASQIRLKIPCREEFAAIVRLQAEAIARRVWFTEEEIYDIITAVGEVCDNAIEHGKSEMGVDVQYLMSMTEFRVEVQDYGRGFDPEGRGEEPPDLFSERGRGIFLMKNLMDRVEIDSQEGRGTRIILGKARRLKPL